MSLLRKNLLKINPYEAGKPIEEIKRELGLREVIKLASNENPLGPSPKAIEAVRRSLLSVNRYPDSNGFYLKKKRISRVPYLSSLSQTCFWIWNNVRYPPSLNIKPVIICFP